MRKIICEKIIRIIKSKGNLEKELNVKLEINEKEVSISGKTEDEYIAERIIEALDFGFPFSSALDIKKDDFIFEILNIKEHATQKNFERIRGRIIGKEGKTLRTISSLSDCHVELFGNKIGIIGYAENIRAVEEACKLLIRGSKQANVYAYLEGHKPEPIIDLGLKEVKKKGKSKQKQ
jgi:ribosomal RNA assembly protein